MGTDSQFRKRKRFWGRAVAMAGRQLKHGKMVNVTLCISSHKKKEKAAPKDANTMQITDDAILVGNICNIWCGEF